jgi:hypothetical protein
MLVAKDAMNVTLPYVASASAGSWWDLQWLDLQTLIFMKKFFFFCFALHCPVIFRNENSVRT